MRRICTVRGCFARKSVQNQLQAMAFSISQLRSLFNHIDTSQSKLSHFDCCHCSILQTLTATVASPGHFFQAKHSKLRIVPAETRFCRRNFPRILTRPWGTPVHPERLPLPRQLMISSARRRRRPGKSNDWRPQLQKGPRKMPTLRLIPARMTRLQPFKPKFWLCSRHRIRVLVSLILRLPVKKILLVAIIMPVSEQTPVVVPRIFRVLEQNSVVLQPNLTANRAIQPCFRDSKT